MGAEVVPDGRRRPVAQRQRHGVLRGDGVGGHVEGNVRALAPGRGRLRARAEQDGGDEQGGAHDYRPRVHCPALLHDAYPAPLSAGTVHFRARQSSYS